MNSKTNFLKEIHFSAIVLPIFFIGLPSVKEHDKPIRN